MGVVPYHFSCVQILTGALECMDGDVLYAAPGTTPSTGTDAVGMHRAGAAEVISEDQDRFTAVQHIQG